jgi:hypothetical protein
MRALINRLFGSAVNSTSSTIRRSGEARGATSPSLEALESRQMLAVVVWDGGPTGTATDFNTAANWVGDVLPGPADTAVINTAGNAITFSSGTRTITNLETSRDMQFSGGSLVTSGTNTITAVLRMQGGTLNGGTWNLSGFGQFSFTTSGGTLANLTTTAELNLGVQSSSITLSGTTTTGTIRLSGNNSNLNLAPGYTLNANVIAEGTGTSTRSITVASGGAGTVTISPSSTITLGVSSGSGLILQQSSVATLINNGLIVNENSSQTLTVSVPAFTNAGTLRATAGNLTVSSTGGWLNSGTIEAAAAGIVNLGGTFNASAGEGTFATSAGQLNVTGTITNTGNTFDLSPTTTGNLRLFGGSINNGFINATGGSTLAASTSFTTLSNVAITGEVVLGVASSQVHLVGSTTFTTLRMVASNSAVYLAPGYVLSNPIVGESASTGTRDIYVAFGGNGTTTISSTGSITAATGLGADVRIFQSSAGTLINDGLIVNQATGRTLQITSLNTFTNGASGIVRATAGSVNINATTWTNAGTLENAAGSNINLGGTFNATGGIGGFNTEPGNVLVTGTVNNAGNTITLNATTGDWTMQGGTISGGSLILNGVPLNTTSSNGTLSNVAITGEVLLSVSSAQLILSGTTTFTALRMSGSNSTLYTTPGFVLSSPIIGEGAATGTRDIYVAFGGNGTTTIASTGSVTAAAGVGADVRIFQSSAGTLINNGLIVNQAAGRTFQFVSLNTFTNAATGIVRATAGGVSIGAVNWTNAGTIENAAGSTITLAGTFNTTGGIGTFNTEPGNVLVTGTINNTGNTITLNATTGDWTMQGGNFSGGSLILNGVPLNTTTTFSTLTNLAITGEVIMNVSSAQLALSGTTTFTTLRMSGGNSTLYTTPGYVINNPIIGEGAATGTRDIYVAYGGVGTTTISSTGSITAATGLGADVRIFQSSAGTLINDGLIVNQATGRTLQITSLNTFTNGASGIVRATAGSVNINATTWTNAGTLENAAGSNINLGGTFNATGGIGTFNTAAGVVNLTGTVNNLGNTITTNAATGSFNIISATINDGSFVLLDGTTLNAPSGFSNISNLSVVGDVVASGSGSIRIVGTTSVTTLRLQGSSGAYFGPDMTLAFPIVVEGASTGGRSVAVAYGGSGGFTIGPSGSIRILAGSGGGLSISQSSLITSFVNNGLISSEAAGRTISISMPVFTNNATLRASGGTLDMGITAQFVNTSTIDLGPGGLIRFTSASGFANAATGTINVTLGGPANTQFGRLQSTSGNITLDGTLNLTIPNNVTIPIVTRFDLITVPGNRTISGDFANITQPPPGPDGKNFFLVSPTVYSFAYSSLADFNSDAVVDLFDYLDFVAAFAAGDPTADFNNDAAIDFFDYLDFLVIFSRF